MEIYLVRHGQTDGNVARRHQADKTLLTPLGRSQAEAVAAKFKKINPTNLISSSLVRAVETASIIGNACDLIPETSANFAEWERPDSMNGHHHGSFRSILFYTAWYFGLKSEGESYQEIRNRFKVARAFFNKYPNDARVVVVSHSVFINLFVAHICNDSTMSLWKAAKFFLSILTMPNTKVVHLNFDKEAPANTCAWRVVK